ncbi:MAG TPA: NAD(P)H-hydrate dehydratase [Candidatus Angelobacter sp.]|jgi:NAD(P)H-hydrate epimerase|nr:NAD(P)H-hydrate dehydratase [Candidatus Angelobacter sp.]
MKILTSDEVRRAEREAVETQELSTLLLMQRAGFSVAQFCLINFKFDSVCVICGKGNNGGDGFVAASGLLEMGKQVKVVVLARGPGDLSADAAHWCERLSVKPLWVSKESDLNSKPVQQAFVADLMIDAIFGIGFKPPLKGVAKRAVQIMNEFEGEIVCVDVPSGVDADSMKPLSEDDDAVIGDGIITFIAPKPAHVFGNLTSGPIAVAELGVEASFIQDTLDRNVTTAQDVAMVFPPRREDSHKGDFGHVLIIAGSLGKAGAAALAGMAALRIGAGLVTVACPESVQSTIAGFAPELMTEGLAETSEGAIALAAESRVDQLLTGKDVIVLGPGLSRNEETAAFIRQFATHCPLPLVLDADGLNAFEKHYQELAPRGDVAALRVLTPHPGEAARLTGIPTKELQADRLNVARRMAKETGAFVVLKGWNTVIASPEGEVYINMTGNPAMAKGGSGDVLSGMIAAALARHQGGLGLLPEAAASEFEEVNALLGELYKVEPHLEKIEDEELIPNFYRISSALKIQKVAAAVYLHGLAGDFSRDMLHENSVLASDINNAIPRIFDDCDLQVERGLFYLHK